MKEIILENDGKGKRTFALIVRGDPADFPGLLEQARAYGFYIVYTKSSFQRLIVEEVPF